MRRWKNPYLRGDSGMFKVRATQEEWLDLPDSDDVMVLRSHAFMRMVNRCFGGRRIVRNFLWEQILEHRPDRMIRILDIGSGSCDIPLALYAWARRRGIALQLLCVEKDQRAFAEGLGAIEKRQVTGIRAYHGDIFEYEPTEIFDYVIGSMFFHHLTNRQILKLIRRLRTYVRRGVFINDLCRSRFTYAGACLLGVGADPRVRHDALLSIRKGFVREELLTLLGQVEDSTVSVRNHRFGRITAWVEFQRGTCIENNPVFA